MEGEGRGGGPTQEADAEDLCGYGRNQRCFAKAGGLGRGNERAGAAKGGERANDGHGTVLGVGCTCRMLESVRACVRACVLACAVGSGARALSSGGRGCGAGRNESVWAPGRKRRSLRLMLATVQMETRRAGGPLADCLSGCWVRSGLDWRLGGLGGRLPGTQWLPWRNRAT